MKRTVVFSIGVLALSCLGAGALRAAGDPPAWAYAVVNTPVARGQAAAHDENELRQLPGSSRRFSLKQVEDVNEPADWFPEDHPAMPDIVRTGRQPGVRACAFCHMPNGKGRPSNAPVAGLPAAYIVQTLNDFRNDLRKTGEPRKTNTNQMIAIAKAMTPEEIQAAADYFASMPWTPWIRVVETELVPKTRIAGSIHFRLPGTDTEPLGMRIVETPENVEETEVLRNPRSGFIAYAPVGSIARGEALVTTGADGKTVKCATCHGPDLKGLGTVPGIAGRSPSYLTRQMYDIQAGARHGKASVLMQRVVAKLTDEDFVAISAYVASLRP
jgi:cytochrome c553